MITKHGSRVTIDAQIEIDLFRRTIWVQLVREADVKIIGNVTAIRVQNIPARMLDSERGLGQLIDIRMEDED